MGGACFFYGMFPGFINALAMGNYVTSSQIEEKRKIYKCYLNQSQLGKMPQLVSLSFFIIISLNSSFCRIVAAENYMADLGLRF